MKKRLVHIFSFAVVLGAIFCMLYRPGERAQGNVAESRMEKPFWKRDRYFIPKKLYAALGATNIQPHDQVFVFQGVGEGERCLLGQFVVVGLGKKHLILQGLKTLSSSKLEQHLAATNQPLNIEIAKANEVSARLQRCKQWMRE